MDVPISADSSVKKEEKQSAVVKKIENRTPQKPKTKECSIVHFVEGPLKGGLNNQLMGFFGLILTALGGEARETPCIGLPEVSSGYPKTKDGRKLHKLITDGVDLTKENWHPDLPPLYFDDPDDAPKVTRHSWDTIWKSYRQYQKRLESVVKKNGPMPKRHALELPFFRGIIMHPAKHISAALQELRLPKEYVAIHARVEKDMREHNFWKKSGHNLSSILEITRKGLMAGGEQKLDGKMQKAMSHIIVAVGTDLMDEDKRVLAAGKPPWGANADMRRIEKPATLDYWDASLLDMIVCVNAAVFVGYSGSTFSNNVAFLRNDPKSSFDYSSGELVERQYNGLYNAVAFGPLAKTK